MINLNKLIIAGTFILIIIFLFHSHLKEGFVQENEGTNKMFEDEYASLHRKRKNGSSYLTKNLLHTVSSHLQNMHIEKTVDLIRKNTVISDGENSEGKVNFSPSNTKQVGTLDEIEHIKRVNNAVQDSIKYHESNPTRENLLKGIFGNN